MVNLSPNTEFKIRHTFIGRKRELQMLGELFKKKSANLVVIRGRRRIGKSRLDQEFAQKNPIMFSLGFLPQVLFQLQIKEKNLHVNYNEK